MSKKEFIGKLEKIDPKKIIDPSNNNELDNFFLILSLIFNDLKGFIFSRKLLIDNYRDLNNSEVSVHAGEFSGLLVQNNKLLISTICEFIEFLNKNQDIFNTYSFKLFIKKVHPDIVIRWNNLLNADTDKNSLFTKIKIIRSNISFHYDQSGSQLRKGFMRSFYKEGKDYKQHESAYYYSNGKMESTRFFYADASVEDYIKLLLSGDDIKNISNTVEDINFVLQNLLNEFIKYKKTKNN